MPSIVSYGDVLSQNTARLIAKRQREFSSKVMLVGVEGLCSSGKSTLVTDLIKDLNAKGAECLVIEGDLFHRGRAVVHSLYEDVIEALRNGYFKICDFHHVLTWKISEIERQVVQPIKNFNESPEAELTLVLKDVLENKTNGTEHEVKINLNKSCIIFLPMVFVRHFKGLDYVVSLDISIDESVKRKLERTTRESIKRDTNLTVNIMRLLEGPTYASFKDKIKRVPDVVINANDFNKTTIEFSK